MVNDDTHLQLTADKAADLLEKYRQQPAAAH
jgi:NADH:ubiquinone oxidoreductase subunit E